MRIVLDVRYRTRSGAVSYLYNLVPRLVDAAGSRHEFILLRNPGQLPPGGVDCETLDVPRHPSAVHALHDQLLLPRLLRRTGADIYHPLKYLGTMRPSCAQVTTVHAITEDYHGVFPTGRAEGVYWKLLGRRIMRASTQLVAVSGYIRDFLVERIGIQPDRITVIPNGIDPVFRRVALPDLSAAPGRFLLTVGNIFPVKNFEVAVQAFAAIAAAHPDLRLKMAGGTRDPYFHTVQERAARLGVLDRIDFLGHVAPEQLVRLMNGATLLLMPSLTEGCPVTLLEAMACGTPILASGRGGIPEVGAAAVTIVQDPHDAAGWAAATRRLLDDDAARQRLAAAGLERAKQFTWDRATAATLAVYDRIASGGRSAIHP